ncbi:MULTISPECIES: response regulator transcription factor [unclassified Streptomyces]|uniref:LuxR C-terminal-related transcriptional regulator n=1 Tax=unclassified Streptomyces TaxID=2593676 RepID=UPI001652EB9D|nr:response regulator transcription factor [Streptomyces sp. sk2.1]
MAVVDPDPIPRGRLAEAGRAAGFTVVCPPDPADWAARTAGPVVLTVLDRDGLAVLERVRAAAPRATVVVLSEPARFDAAVPALRRGAGAVIDRGTDPGDVVLAVRLAARGHAVVPAGALAALTAPETTRTAGAAPMIDLDEAERRLLQELATGATVQRIARHRYQAPRTVERHLSRLYTRMGAGDRVQAVAKATQLGLIDIPC